MSGIFGSSQWMYNSGADFYNGVATQSVRLDDGSSAYLTFTPSSASSATDRRKVTHSVWVKRGVLGADQSIYSANRASGGDYYLLRFSSDNKLTLILDVDAGGYGYDTSAVFRDVGAWYHVCVIIDTTQATDTNRVKIYVNGVLQDKTTKYAGGHVPQNFSTYVMDGNEDEVGRFAFTDASYFDGYMAEFITTIGQDNTISEFGELKNGVWIPIDYAGSYGGNGFRLQFNQTGTGTASSSTIGADTSGNANHFTSSGIVASDCSLLDSPENNFCTFNTLDNDNITLSEGNLQGISTANAHNAVGTTFAVTGGKWYWEVRPSVADTAHFFGMGRATFSFISQYTNDGYNFSDLWAIAIDGNKSNGAGNVSYGSALAGGDILNIAFDLDNGKFYAGKNGTYFNSGDPVSGTNPAFSNVPTDEAMMPFYGSSTTPRSHIINFGQDSSFAGNTTAGGNTDGNGKGDFKYAPPSGFLALCSANLPEPTISPNADTQPDDYFTPTLYTSDNIGAGGTQSVTGVGFQPDWVWIKNISSDATSHTLFDSVRTAGKMLQSDNDSLEASNSQYGYLSSFDIDGFTLTGGTTNANFINQGTDAYVSWNWKAGGTAVSNTDGTITSSVSANTDAGFSIVAYQGNDASSATIGHGLSQAPEMVIVKNRQEAISNPAWAIYHSSLGATKYIDLSTTTASDTATSVWNDTAPTSTVVTIGTADSVNSGSNHIMYCFHSVDSYSKFGTYTGNDSTDGNFIYLGFRPSFIIIKYASGTAGGTKNWFMFDDARDTFNPTDDTINANAADGETANSNKDLDFLSNGFKIRNAEGAINNAAEYIYMAWASTPFKYSNAR